MLSGIEIFKFFVSDHLNYRARATFGPSTLNYSLNGVANAW